MPTAKRLLAIAALVTASAVATVAPPAFAGEPTAADIESALQLYKDGKRLRDTGDLPRALEKLRAAHALVETPITALELGRTYAMMGKLVEAREILLAVPRIPVRKNESQKAVEARKDAESLAADLKPRLSSIVLQFPSDASAPPRITVDGVEVPHEAARAPRIVNPGRHVIVVERSGKTIESDVTLSEGQTREVALEIPPATTTTEGPPPTPTPATETSPGGRSPLVYAGFGTAIIGIGVGTVTGILTLSKAGSLKDTCRDERCPPSAQSELDGASTTGMISTVAFAIGAAGLAVGVVALVLDKSATPAASARIVVSPTGAALRGTF